MSRHGVFTDWFIFRRILEHFSRENGISAPSMSAFEALAIKKGKQTPLKGQKYHFRSVGLVTGLWDLKILLIPARTGLKINWSEKAAWREYIHYLHVNPQILHNHCFQFLQGITVVQREIKDNRYAKFGERGGGVNKVHYGPCENGEWNLLTLGYGLLVV